MHASALLERENMFIQKHANSDITDVKGHDNIPRYTSCIDVRSKVMHKI